jgi:hypothetical protein
MLVQMMAIPRFVDLKSELADLRAQAESVSRQVAAFAQSVQNSEIKGPRYLNDAMREQHERRRAAAFLDKIKSMAPSFDGDPTGGVGETVDGQDAREEQGQKK